MTLVAVTDINHGNGEDGVVTISAGEEVKDLPEEVVDRLKEIGSVTEEVLPEGAQDRIQELESEVAALRAQLGEASHKENVSQAMFEQNGGLEAEADGTLEVDDEAAKVAVPATQKADSKADKDS
jgi:hypothetical protein